MTLAPDLVIMVPVGTQVLSEDKEEVLADFTEVGQRVVMLSLQQHTPLSNALAFLCIRCEARTLPQQISATTVVL